MSERPYDWDAKEREATEHIRRQTAELRDELSKPSIQDQLTAAQARVAGHIKHIKQLEAEVERLNAIKFRRFGNEDCWIYQGDGEDHLESLVCPVVVSPQKMMEFEGAQSRVAELERLLRRSLPIVSECDWNQFPTAEQLEKDIQERLSNQ